MVPLALALITGIWLGDAMGGALPVVFTLLLVNLSIAVAWARARCWLLLGAVFLTGWFDLLVHTSVISPHDVRNVFGKETRIVRAQGELMELHEPRPADDAAGMAPMQTAIVELHAWQDGDEWNPVAGRVLARLPAHAMVNAAVGSRVEIDGLLKRPPSAVAEGLFDYQKHLARRGIHHVIECSRPSDVRLEDPARQPALPQWRSSFQAWARGTIARGLPANDESVQLLWAMTLGWRAALTDEVAEPFMRSGTMHIFAISGLHVALIAAVMVHLLRLAMVPRGWCGCVVLPLLWFYAFATGWQPSAVRSTIMAGVIIAGWALSRPSDLVNSLAAAACIILVCDPNQLFGAGFQLSFVVVLSIALLLPHFERWRAGWMQPDPFLPPELRPQWQRWLDAPLRLLTGNVATSLAAWLGSLPLVACYFHLLTPVSLIANVLIVPLSALALMSCCGSLLFGAWLPAIGELFNFSAWHWMNWMRGTSAWCAELPGAWFPVPGPSGAALVLYYTVLLALVTGAAFKRSHWRWLGPVTGVLLVWLTFNHLRHRDEVRLDVLALRGGESLVLDAPGRAGDCVIDCATESDYQAVVAPFLKSRGWRRVPNLILTHGDHRHVSGFPTAMALHDPPSVFTSGLGFRSPAYRAAIQTLSGRGDVHQRVHDGDHAGPWEVLHPGAGDRFSQADDGALVLRASFHGIRLLLCSDLGREGQRTLLERHPDLKADIVIAGVPAQGEPLRQELLDVIQPQLIILSVAEFPAGERPGAVLRQRLAAYGVPVIHTLDAGSVLLRFRPEACEVRTMSGWTVRMESRGSTME